MRAYEYCFHYTHVAWLSTGAIYTMPPLPRLHDDVLDRTIRNIEQAQGKCRHRTTAADILQATASNEAELASLPSTGMAGLAPTSVNIDDPAANIPSLAPINLTSDLAASTTLLQSLRVRNSILVADLARAMQSLQHHEEKAIKVLSLIRRSRAKWMIAAVCSLMIWMVYLWWCWNMRVEFQYIRKRRGEVFGL